MPKPEIHLVLSGAGARFPAFVGALRAIEEAGVVMDQIIGTSGGALVGAFYKAGVPITEMEQLTLDTDFTDFASFGLLQLWSLPFRGYLNPSAPVRRFLRDRLGDRTFADVPGFAAVVTDLTREKTIVCDASTTPHLPIADGVYASGAIPLVFEPLSHHGSIWVDGSVRYDFALDWSPLSDGKAIIGVKVRSPYTAPRSSAPIEILRSTVTNMIDAADRCHIDSASSALWIDVALRVGPLDFALNRTEKVRLIESGYAAMRNLLPALLDSACRTQSNPEVQCRS